MKTVIIVSKCTRVIRRGHSGIWLQFHFKGVFGGQIIDKVILKPPYAMDFKKGEEYLMYVQVFTSESRILKGEIVKFKLLSECWDKS